MKNLKQILVSILVLTIFFSCKKDEKEIIVSKETISAKWVANGISSYKSFEFNTSGNYIVVKSADTKTLNGEIVLFGTYDIIDKTTIELSDFGTLTVSDINDNSIQFSIQLDGDTTNEIVVTALKQEEMENSTKTELLCRTWKMISIDDESVVGTEFELMVLFSKAGTYFVELVNPSDEHNGGLSNWKWSDNTETKFLYSWENPPVWNESKIVEILELTNNSLKLLERFDNNEESIYILVPLVNTKSSVNKSILKPNKSNKRAKVGFLKN